MLVCNFPNHSAQNLLHHINFLQLPKLKDGLLRLKLALHHLQVSQYLLLPNCTHKNGLELIFSSLEHLRSAFSVAKEEHQEFFIPQRTLPLTFGKVNIVTFASHDTRLIVGLERGAVAIYDTEALFTSGSGDIQPLKIAQLQPEPLRQIMPNPGAEHNLSNLFVVVGDGKVALLDIQLEPQGGWTASDSLTRPITGLYAYCLISTFDLQYQIISCLVTERETSCYRITNWGYFDLFFEQQIRTTQTHPSHR